MWRRAVAILGLSLLLPVTALAYIETPPFSMTRFANEFGMFRWYRGCWWRVVDPYVYFICNDDGSVYELGRNGRVRRLSPAEVSSLPFDTQGVGSFRPIHSEEELSRELSSERSAFNAQSSARFGSRSSRRGTSDEGDTGFFGGEGGGASSRRSNFGGGSSRSGFSGGGSSRSGSRIDDILNRSRSSRSRSDRVQEILNRSRSSRAGGGGDFFGDSGGNGGGGNDGGDGGDFFGDSGGDGGGGGGDDDDFLNRPVSIFCDSITDYAEGYLFGPIPCTAYPDVFGPVPSY